MKAYRLTERAQQDMLDIWSHIVHDSRSAADRFIDRLHEKFKQLVPGTITGEQFIDSRGRQARRITYGSYVIFHRRVGQTVEIIRVVHGARSFKDLDD